MLGLPTEINQQALADALNVSRSTVSRSFTNHPGIKPETRAKVFELASKVGLSPHAKSHAKCNMEELRKKR